MCLPAALVRWAYAPAYSAITTVATAQIPVNILRWTSLCRWAIGSASEFPIKTAIPRLTWRRARIFKTGRSAPSAPTCRGRYPATLTAITALTAVHTRALIPNIPPVRSTSAVPPTVTSTQVCPPAAAWVGRGVILRPAAEAKVMRASSLIPVLKTTAC
ncbi:hypothetical protein D3C72_1463370 [compost metagenome]